MFLQRLPNNFIVGGRRSFLNVIKGSHHYKGWEPLL